MDTKTAKYYEVRRGTNWEWSVKLRTDELNDAFEYLETHEPRWTSVWVVFTDGTDRKVAA